MRLPNAQLAIVEDRKILEYLLEPSHPDNGGKARFFTAAGFRRDRWHEFARALREQASSAAVIECIESAHGRKFVIDGPIRTPAGSSPTIRSVWIVNHGWHAPRLVTAYPREPQESSSS